MPGSTTSAPALRVKRTPGSFKRTPRCFNKICSKNHGMACDSICTLHVKASLGGDVCQEVLRFPDPGIGSRVLSCSVVHVQLRSSVGRHCRWLRLGLARALLRRRFTPSAFAAVLQVPSSIKMVPCTREGPPRRRRPPAAVSLPACARAHPVRRVRRGLLCRRRRAQPVRPRKRTPGSFRRTPGSFKRTPGSFKRTPGSF